MVDPSRKGAMSSVCPRCRHEAAVDCLCERFGNAARVICDLVDEVDMN